MSWRVVLAAESGEREVLIAQTLIAAGHELVARLAPDGEIAAAAARVQPDLVVVEVPAVSEALIARLRPVALDGDIPLALFTCHGDGAMARLAVNAGVSAYVVNGLSAERVIPVLETAQARFLAVRALRRERDDALARLAERVVIERAKGILMRRRQVPEPEAYHALRRMAMDRGQRLGTVAETIVSAEEMLAGS